MIRVVRPVLTTSPAQPGGRIESVGSPSPGWLNLDGGWVPASEGGSDKEATIEVIEGTDVKAIRYENEALSLANRSF